MKQRIKSGNWMRTALSAILGGMLMLAGCESNSESHLSDGHDFGPNNPSLFVAIGDSVTAGSGLDSPSDCYTVKLAGMLGKTVLNYGYPGASSGEVMDALYASLDNDKPGFALILIGYNDLIMGYGEETAAVNIRIMIQACLDNKTIPVIATLTPVFGGYKGLYSGIERLNAMIRQIQADLESAGQKVGLVDLFSAFVANPVASQEPGEQYVQSDGLHPNVAGHSLMAITFYDKVK